MKPGLKNDIIAGFSVFLLALPLCLGIAMASHFPPMAGILSAIVGGIVTSFFGGAQLSIKGPAAGLIVIAIGAITELGYEATLAVGVVAALIQIGIGVWRKAVIAEIMPPFVVHGMLAAIGVIIFSQQIYVMMGITPQTSKPIPLLLHLPMEIIHANPAIFSIGMLALAIAIGWPFLKKVAVVPSTLVILLIIIPLSLLLDLSQVHSYLFLGHTYTVGPDFLIHLPSQLLSAITFPDFSTIFTPASIKYILMFALVGSIESLLTTCAVNSMAPQDSPTDLNRDLCAVGVGNLVSACIGGLPMISEIVRSKANIDYGATSIRSNFFHGLFMLIAVIFLPRLINLIPLTALAALLVAVGLKLASPKQFAHAYAVGKDQLACFLVTFLMTLATDLLIGVMSGIALKLIIHVARGNKLFELFSPVITTKKVDDTAHIEIDGPLTFVGYLKLKWTIENAFKQTKYVVIHLETVTYIDHTAAEKLIALPKEFENLKITLEDNQELTPMYYPLLVAKRSSTRLGKKG